MLNLRDPQDIWAETPEDHLACGAKVQHSPVKLG